MFRLKSLLSCRAFFPHVIERAYLVQGSVPFYTSDVYIRNIDLCSVLRHAVSFLLSVEKKFL